MPAAKPKIPETEPDQEVKPTGDNVIPETGEAKSKDTIAMEAEVNDLRLRLAQAANTIEDLTINLEIANDRWVKTVNEAANVELAARKQNKEIKKLQEALAAVQAAAQPA